MMRATVEIEDERWAKLKELAARQGERGYSTLLNEAIDLLVAKREHAALEDRRRIVEQLQGSITEDSAQGMRESIRELRERWET